MFKVCIARVSTRRATFNRKHYCASGVLNLLHPREFPPTIICEPNPLYSHLYSEWSSLGALSIPLASWSWPFCKDVLRMFHHSATMKIRQDCQQTNNVCDCFWSFSIHCIVPAMICQNRHDYFQFIQMLISPCQRKKRRNIGNRLIVCNPIARIISCDQNSTCSASAELSIAQQSSPQCIWGDRR